MGWRRNGKMIWERATLLGYREDIVGAGFLMGLKCETSIRVQYTYMCSKLFSFLPSPPSLSPSLLNNSSQLLLFFISANLSAVISNKRKVESPSHHFLAGKLPALSPAPSFLPPKGVLNI